MAWSKIMFRSFTTGQHWGRPLLGRVELLPAFPTTPSAPEPGEKVAHGGVLVLVIAEERPFEWKVFTGTNALNFAILERVNCRSCQDIQFVGLEMATVNVVPS